MADDNIDALLHVLWAHPSGNIIENYIRAYNAIKDKYQKPVATWIYGPNNQAVRQLGFQLEDMGFPVFKDLEAAVKALGLAIQYAKTRLQT